MRRGGVFFGLWVGLWLVPGQVRAQSDTFYQQPTDIGVLRNPGYVGRSNVDVNLAKTGGLHTGRYINPQSPYSLPSRPSSSYASPSAQRALPGRSNLLGYGGGGQIQSPLSFRERATSRNMTYDYNREQSYVTRPELVRGRLPPRVRDTGPLVSPAQQLMRGRMQRTPITALLERGNLLRPKSALARLVSEAGGVGPLPPVDEFESMPIAGVDETGPTNVPADVTARLEDRLARQHQRYFADGTAFFHRYAVPDPSEEPGFNRKTYLIRAQDCFNICETLDSSAPQPRVAEALVAFEREDLNTAIGNLIRAVKRAKQPDDLRIDLDKFYGHSGAFETTLDRAAVLANRTGQPSYFFLLAYFSWLNNDLTGATAAMEKASTGVPEQLRPEVTQFRDMLTQQKKEGRS